MPRPNRRKAASKLVAPFVKPSAGVVSKPVIDESRTIVSSAPLYAPHRPKKPPAVAVHSSARPIEISSDSSNYASDDDDDDDEEVRSVAELMQKTNHSLPSDDDHRGPEPRPQSSTARIAKIARSPSPQAHSPLGSPEPPTFGELALEPLLIQVPGTTSNPVPLSASLPTRFPGGPDEPIGAAAAASALVGRNSLATVLAQALRSNDSELLESCLMSNDLHTVRATIERLDSRLASTLLSRLASRIHRRPGRAGNLLTWVQWTIIAHGGALAAQPDVVARLAGLQKVLEERARGLHSLLVLKGKLDLLDGQMKLRRTRQRRHSAADDEEDVIWVEGEDHDDGGAEEGDGHAGQNGQQHDGFVQNIDDATEDAMEIRPMANGIAGNSDGEEDSSADDDSSEASDADDHDASSVEHDADSHADDADESDLELGPEREPEPAPPPAKIRRLSSRHHSAR